MSLKVFKLIDGISIDTSIIKQDYLMIYHQQGAQLIDFNQGINFLFFGGGGGRIINIAK